MLVVPLHASETPILDAGLFSLMAPAHTPASQKNNPLNTLVVCLCASEASIPDAVLLTDDAISTPREKNEDSTKYILSELYVSEPSILGVGPHTTDGISTHTPAPKSPTLLQHTSVGLDRLRSSIFDSGFCAADAISMPGRKVQILLNMSVVSVKSVPAQDCNAK
ncbi:hypothetical protein B0H17DRAFT_1135814 [Mycena rosella]|uniref:Uncharacterized protein n=1 Tax=Mycena rosella TaxID=1033263 RepID=A0AAD7DC35_MYCRO|nr:hypothetical protein B0H17DRAFT_1135814 [Mycena rosella]